MQFGILNQILEQKKDISEKKAWWNLNKVYSLNKEYFTNVKFWQMYHAYVNIRGR